MIQVEIARVGLKSGRWLMSESDVDSMIRNFDAQKARGETVAVVNADDARVGKVTRLSKDDRGNGSVSLLATLDLGHVVPEVYEQPPEGVPGSGRMLRRIALWHEFEVVGR